MEKQVRDAIIAELTRQASIKPGALKVQPRNERLQIEGEVDLDQLVMAIIGSVAGGP
jgi:hypothetical protein